MTYAFTITIVTEIERGGYLFCGKCGTKLMVVISEGSWAVDDEAFKSGEQRLEECPDEVFVGEVAGHFCSKCEQLTSLSYNY